MSSVSSLNSLLSSATSTDSSSSIDISSLLAAATGASSTGIDVTSAVQAAVYAAQAPERQWQAEQTTAKSQITALTSIQTALTSLSTDADDLNNLNGSLAARTVSSSSSAVTATATAGATIGTHSVAVSNLATAASWYSPDVASANAPLGTMQLNLVSQSGTTTSFSTGSGTSGDTLTDLASSINNSNLGVTASVITDSSGSRLALVSSSTGAANDFSVSYGAISGSSWTSTSVASASTALSAGSFQVGDGTSTSTINVAAGSTLSDVASQINSSGLNVTASVVTDTSGAHLSIASADSGTVAVTGDPAFSLTRASQGADASLTVDGIPVTSASNTVSGVVSGLTLNLLGTTSTSTSGSASASTPATLAVAADTSTITGAVSQFVTDYNSALSLVNTQFTYSSSSSSQGVLSGDSTTRSLQSALMGMMGYTSSSSSSTSSSTSSSSSSVLSLASLGITMNNDGSLTLDSNQLSQAVASNPSSVQNFFQGTALNGFAQSFNNTINTFNDPSTGALTSEISNLNQTYTDLQSQVDDYQNGYIASQTTALTAMYSQAEIALQSLPTTLKQLQAELGNNSGS